MTRTSLATAHRRYHSYAGFVTTPPYFDDSPQQFLDVAPRGTGAIQRVLHVPDYDWQLDQRARNFGLLEEAAGCLADSQCDVIGQVGSNWVHCRGTTGPAEIEAFCARLKEQTGAGFRMMQVVDAVEGEIATPVVGSDFALYWAMLRELGRAAGPGWGHLLSTLDETTERSTDRPARATVSS
jgi:hypothetical protein